MGDESIIYDFSGIGSVTEQISAFVRQTRGTLDDVEREFNTLLANGWTGTAADSFNGCRTAWNKAANDMATTLATLGGKVDTAATDMQQTDRANAGRFQPG
jgi:WXG100 family type VII secretion target